MQYLRGHTLGLVIIIVILLCAGFYTLTVVKNNIVVEKKPAVASLETSPLHPPYTNIKGEPLFLEDFIGTIIVVHSWASWCPSCKTQLLQLSELSNRYNENEVRILAINRAEQSTTAERYLRSIAVSDRVLLVLDSADRYYKSIGGYSMPETVIYDREGNIVSHNYGDVTLENLEKQIGEAIDNNLE